MPKALAIPNSQQTPNLFLGLGSGMGTSPLATLECDLPVLQKENRIMIFTITVKILLHKWDPFTVLSKKVNTTFISVPMSLCLLCICRGLMLYEAE